VRKVEKGDILLEVDGLFLISLWDLSMYMDHVHQDINFKVCRMDREVAVAWVEPFMISMISYKWL
jgi:hypothetical protein